MSAHTRSTPIRRRRNATVRILFTCVGRRVELINAFRRAADRLRIKLTVHGADASALSPAMHLVDKAHVVPAIGSGRYIRALKNLVRDTGIDLLVPLLDPELPLLAAAATQLRDLGCTVLVSTESVVQTCADKLATYRLLERAHIDTPRTWTWTEATDRATHRFPLFLKPRRGSAATGDYTVRTEDELRTFGLRVPDPIVQEFVSGQEHTLDVYTGFDGRPRCVVPRKRLEVRTGEVSKGLIVKDPTIMAVGMHVAQALDGCRGVINVQCIVTPKGRIRVIEINPRFGGGVPLSIHAGADFPRWILSEFLGKRVRISPTAFRDDIAMLRYDESVFVPHASRLC
ncbi:MAG: ATP-grasp domain-containing protein [Phycisphaerae bacterium]